MKKVNTKFDNLQEEEVSFLKNLYKGYIELENGLTASDAKRRGKTPYQFGKKPVCGGWSKDESAWFKYDEIKDKIGFGGIIRDDIVVIDCDNEIDDKCMERIVKHQNLQCAIAKTNNGHHYYFKRDKNSALKNLAKYYTYCGFQCDYRVVGGQTALKVNGESRLLEYLPEGELSELPKFLLPYDSKMIGETKTEKSKYVFRDLISSDDWGEHTLLCSYITLLKASARRRNSQVVKFSDEEIIDLIKAINSMLDSPKNERELETEIANPRNLENLNNYIEEKGESKRGSVDRPFFDGGKFLCEDLARAMINKYGKKIAFIDNILYVKNNEGVYEINDDLIKKIISEFQTNLTDGQKGEVIKALSTTHDIHVFTTSFSNPNLIPFKTAVYDLENDKLINYTDDMVFGYKLPFEYNSVAKPTELVNKILNDLSCNDSKRRALMEEGLGYALYHDNDLARGKALILTGKTHSGKSTYQDLCRIVLTGDIKPTKITTSIKLHNFTNMGNKTEYYIADLVSSWLNIGDDISAQDIKNTDAIKSLISGEPLTGRACGSSKIIDFIPKTKFIFSCNAIPSMKDEGGALSSRLVFVHFGNEFRTKGYLEDNPESKAKMIDTKLMNKLLNDKDSLAYLVYLAVQGLKRLKENNDFTMPMSEKQISDNFTKECDTISTWIEEFIGDSFEEVRAKFINGYGNENTGVTQWYQMYEEYCKKGHLIRESLKSFSTTIREKYNLTSENKYYRQMEVESGMRYGNSIRGKCFSPL